MVSKMNLAEEIVYNFLRLRYLKSKYICWMGGKEATTGRLFLLVQLCPPEQGKACKLGKIYIPKFIADMLVAFKVRGLKFNLA